MANRFALSASQRDLAVFRLLHGDSSMFNIGGFCEIAGDVDEGLLADACSCLVQRHDALRTAIERHAHDEEFTQTFSTDHRVQFEVQQSSALHGGDCADRLRHGFSAPFSIQGEALYRARLTRTGPTSRTLSLECDHLIADGWSMALLQRSLSEIYGDLQCGRSVSLQAPSFGEQVLREQRYLASDKASRSRSYWLDKFRHPPSPLFAEPGAGIAEAGPGWSLSSERLVLPRERSHALHALARRHDVSLSQLATAAAFVELARMREQREALVGISVHNRIGPLAKQTVGLFSSLVPARYTLDPDEDMPALVQRMARALIDDYRHRQYPSSLVRQAVCPAGGGWFDFTVSYERYHQPVLRFGNAVGVVTVLPNLRSTIPLQMHIRDLSDGRMDIECFFSGRHFSEGELALVLDRMVYNLETMALDPRRPIAKWPAPVPGEDGMVARFGGLSRGDDPPDCRDLLLQDSVERIARSPMASAVAVEHLGTQLTYAELDAASNRLARHLVELGVRPEGLVGLCMDRGIPAIIAMLAILKAGGAYVPLDPSYPPRRLQAMLADCRPAFILTQACWTDLLHRCAGDARLVLFSDGPNPWDALCGHAFESKRAAPGNLAYVIYTSGSSGEPKGVMVEHRNVVRTVQALVARYGLRPDDRVLQFATLNFDASVEEIFCTFAAGGCLVLRTPEWLTDAHHFWHLCEVARITILDLPTRYLLQLVDPPQRPLPTCVRAVIVGGEALPARFASDWVQAKQPITLFNTYGPTETTIVATVAEVAGQGPAARSIGRPIHSARIHVLDGECRPVPIGVRGEIYVGGPCVARGYLNKKDLTAQRFFHDPSTAVPHARMYRTGDIGRWLADGNLEFLGRSDRQVKIRGHRVEPGEVEAHLLASPGVREAAVLLRADGGREPCLVAYVAGTLGDDWVSRLRDRLGQVLPAVMVPTAWVKLASLPVGPHGKLDHGALPSPADPVASSPANDDSLAMEPLHQAVAKIWSEVLEVPGIGPLDNFLDLGGHSLSALQVISRLRETLSIDVPATLLLKSPSLDAFVRQLPARRERVEVPLRAAKRELPLPMSFAQERLWFLSRLGPTLASAYQLCGGLRLVGALDVPALQAALDHLVRRHEILRTTFHEVDGMPGQHIEPPGRGISLRCVDLSEHPDPEAAVQTVAREESGVGFDLSRGPLARACLFRLGAQEHVLLLTMHHIIGDGWSTSVLMNELGQLYDALHEGKAVSMPSPSLQYADFAVWQRSPAHEHQTRVDVAYWRDALSGAAEVLDLPTDHRRPELADSRGQNIPVRLEPELVAALRAQSRRLGTTLFVTLMAGWSLLLARWSGQTDLTIGAPVVNRARTALESMVGLLVNMLPMRVRLVRPMTVADLLRQVGETVAAAQSRADFPFERLVELCNPARSLSRHPLFQVVLAMQNMPRATARFAGLRSSRFMLSPVHARMDVELELFEEGGEVTGTCTFASSLFERTTIERHLAQWRTVLRAMARDDRAQVWRLPLLDEAQRRHVLFELNGHAGPIPAGTVHDWVRRHAQQRPEAVALACEGEILRYGELDRRATLLAHRLRELGVAREHKVAIALERGPDLVVAILATLKAGGAYVPLDLGYPVERLKFMLDDCRPLALISRAGCLKPFGGLPPGLQLVDIDRPVAAPCGRSELPDVLPADLAYVIYTSGSTGQPKGVMVEHGGLSNLVHAQIDGFALTSSSRLLQFAPISFDASVSEIFTALCAGAVLHLPRAGSLVGRELLEYLRHEEIAHLTVPPSVLATLPADGGLEALKTLVLAGEAAPPDLVQRWCAGRVVINAYGPTETTVCATMHRWARRDRGRPVIGQPLPNVRVYVLDEDRQPLPVGSVGELFVGGAGVARGYLNQPELTAERFVDDPFRPGERMYRTGDLCRWLGEGVLEFAGRCDSQVKLRGCRVELGEIEANLRACPGIRDAAVICDRDPWGNPRLVAYLTGEPPPDWPASLRSAVRRRLPDFMLPAAWARLPALPLTPNGKVDRRALPALDACEPASGGPRRTAPVGSIEETLARHWAELLQVSGVSREDDFFALGGHSLLVTRLQLRVQQAFGVDLQVRDVFEQPTLSALADLIARTRPSSQAVPRQLRSLTRVTLER